MPVDPERLWEALTDPDQLSGWFGASVDWDLTEGAPARFRDDDGTVRNGTIEVVRPARHLRFRWRPEREDDPIETEVSYLLEPVEDGTRLTIQERQLAADEGSVGAPGARAWAGGWSGWDAHASDSGWSHWDSRLAGAWMTLQSTGARV